VFGGVFTARNKLMIRNGRSLDYCLLASLCHT